MALHAMCWLFAGALTIGPVAGADTIVGWQFEDGRLPYLQRAIEEAGKNNVNHIQFSPAIVHSVSDFIGNAERLREIRQATLAARQKEMTVFVWTRELQDIPAGTRVSLEDSDVWNALHERYRKLNTALPGIDGLVLSLEEADVSLFDTKVVVSTVDRSARLTKLIDETHSICSELDWDLWVRVFADRPEDLEWVIKGISDANPAVGVLIPIVPYEWHPTGPFHPALGKFAGRRQIVEFDLGNRNFGRSLVPYCYPDRIRDQLIYAREKGVVGAVARVDCGRDHCLGSPCGVNLVAFSRYLRQPDASIDLVWSDYLSDSFGSRDYKQLRDCLEPTKDIVEHVFLSQGSLFLSDESRIPDPAGAAARLADRGLAIWDPSYRATERKLRTITSKVAQSLILEKDEAVARCLEARSTLERARASIPVSVYILLSSQLSILEDAARFWRDLGYAYCAYQLWTQDRSEKSRARLAMSHTHLTSWSRYFRTVYGFGHPVFNVRRLEQFAEKIAPPPPPEQQTSRQRPPTQQSRRGSPRSRPRLR